MIPGLLSIRTAASAARTAVYGSIGAMFALSEVDAQKTVEAVVIGGVLADYITWLLRNLILMPRYIWHGCYDIVVNILFGWFLMQHMQIDVGSDPGSLAAAFLAFMLMTAVKVTIYSVQWLQETE